MVGSCGLCRRRRRQHCCAIQTFNDQVAADDRVELCILPVSDGLTIIRKRSRRDPYLRPPDGVSSTVTTALAERDVNEPEGRASTSADPCAAGAQDRPRSAVPRPLPAPRALARAGLRRSRAGRRCRAGGVRASPRAMAPVAPVRGSGRLDPPGRRQPAARRAPAVGAQAPGRRSAGRRTSRCRCCSGAGRPAGYPRLAAPSAADGGGPVLRRRAQRQ